MAFELVQIRSTLNAITPVYGYREDLAIGDLVGLSLSDPTGVSTFRWSIIGRPEGSVAGGAGPEPCLLSVASTASFTVDSDAGFAKDGTYIVECLVNEGSPTETRIRAGLVRPNTLTLSDGRDLRKIGGFEALEDTSDPLVRQGYATMVNRWFQRMAEVIPATPSYGAVVSVDTDPNDDGISLDVPRADHKHNVLTAAPGPVSAVPAAEGTSLELARADHVHSVDTAVPVDVGSANAEGVATDLARADHVHDHGAHTDPLDHAVATPLASGFMSDADKTTLDTLVAGLIFTINVRNESGAPIAAHKLVYASGFSVPENRILVDVADKDDPAKRPSIGVVTGALADLTNGTVLVAGLLTHDTSAFSITDQLVLGNSGDFDRPPPDNVAFTGEIQNVGVVARVDAVNGLIVLVPDGLAPVSGDQVFALAGTDGTPSDLNRYVTDSDPRLHDLASAAPADVDKSAAQVGISADAARADHKHDILTDVPVSIGGANLEGVSNKLARSDHQHLGTTLTAAAPADVTKAAAAVGVSTESAHADHKHDISTGVPVDLGAAAAEGVATSMARSDHVHLSPYQQTVFAEISADTTTASAAFGTLISQNITKIAGTKLKVLFTFSFSNTTASDAFVSFRLTVDGVVRRAVASFTTDANAVQSGALAFVVSGLAAGVRNVLIEWKTTAGTAQIRPVTAPDNESAALVIEEVTV